MMNNNLGRLNKIELRNIWPSESADFTPWLAKEKNLELLGETIGIELELEAKEKNVGPFRADILCKDTANDHWVLIENQLEKTNHTHLGQILTYAAGLEAATIVWVAERFTEEHRAALDWLNEHTDEHLNFFGLETELWQIGNSDIAPKFNIVCQPNNWSRSVRQAAIGEITEYKQMQLQFWAEFKTYMEKNSKIKCPRPYPQHWMNHSIGRTGFYLASIISLSNSETKTRDPEMRVELSLSGNNAKLNFEVLQQKREEIEKALDYTVTWHNPEEKNQCRLFVRKNADFLDQTLWQEQHDWLQSNLEKFNNVFRPIIRNL
jgi:hypothetical protein